MFLDDILACKLFFFGGGRMMVIFSELKKKKRHIQFTYLSTVFWGTIRRILKLEFVSIPCTHHNYRVGQRDQSN